MEIDISDLTDEQIKLVKETQKRSSGYIPFMMIRMMRQENDPLIQHLRSILCQPQTPLDTTRPSK